MCSLVSDTCTSVLTMLQTELPKFVQINWCGDGVPESKKGLFRTSFILSMHLLVLTFSKILIQVRLQSS